MGVSSIPSEAATPNRRELRKRREPAGIRFQEIRTGQRLAVERNRFFAMGQNRNHAMRTKGGERGRLEHQARPDFAVSKIIEPTERGFAQDFGSEIDGDFAILVNGEIALQSVDDDGDSGVFAAANDVEMLGRKLRRNERTQFLERAE